MKHPPWITLSTIAFCAFASQSLIVTWRTSPFERYSWIPMLIWLCPAVNWSETLSTGQTRGIASAIAVTFFGILASVNTIKIAGLAIAIVSLVPWSVFSALWLCLMISWLPALSWVMVHAFPYASDLSMLAGRIFLALLGTGVMWRKNNDTK